MRLTALVLYRCLTVVGVGCLATWATVSALARVANARNGARLADLIRTRAAAPADPRSQRRVETGDLLGRIDVPRIGISTVILEGTDERELEQAAGHIPGTALPGEDGNVGLAAHRDSYFRPLRDVAVGDLLTVTTPDEVRSYAVAAVSVVDPSDPAALAPTPANRLTLVTCYPFSYVGSAPYRFVVVANEVGSPRRATAEEFRAGVTADVRPRPAVVRHRSVRPPRPRAAAPAVPQGLPPGVKRDFGPPPAPPHKLPWWKRLFHRHRAAPVVPPRH